MSISDLLPHPLADALPRMSEPEMRELVQDMALHGQREAATIWADPHGVDWLLDGRHRAEAARALGIQLRTERFRGDEDAARQLVMSLNVRRRHLTPSQKALAAASLATRRRGGVSGLSSQEAKFPIAPTQQEVAVKMGVSARSVRDGSAVMTHGDQALITAVANGEISVSAAAKLARGGRSQRQAATAIYLTHRRSSSSDSWLTPAWIAERAAACLGGIDGDVAAAPEMQIPAAWSFTEETDAFAQASWANPDGTPSKVWMNPPYNVNGQGPGVWTRRIVEEWLAGNVGSALVLLPARPGSHWQQALAQFPRVEIRGHLVFEPGEGNPARLQWEQGRRAEAPFASILVGVGVSASSLYRHFGDVGVVFVAYNAEDAGGRLDR